MENRGDSFVKKLKKRIRKAETRKRKWHDLYEECYEYVLPQRENFSNQTQGQHRNEDKTYDSTARNAVYQFANRIQSVMTPSNSKWARLIAGENVNPNEADKVNRELQRVTDVAFQYINSSNMAVEVGESYLDLAVGTAGFVIEDSGDITQPIRFKSIGATELILEEGPWGMVDTVFRKFEVTARNMKRQYSKVHPDRVAECEENPDNRSTVYEAVIFNPETKMYDFFAIDSAKNFIMEENSMEISPWVVFRWATTSGEIYGRGPVVNALPDIKTLNRIAELELRSAALSVNGIVIFNGESDLTTKNISLQPGAKIATPENADLRPLDLKNELQIAQLSSEKLREEIKLALFANRLPPPSASAHTATEISIRQRELQQDIGASFGRLQRELIVPIMKRVIAVLQAHGIIGELRLDDSQLINIQVSAPITRNNGDVDNVLEFLQNMGIAGQLFGPEFLKNAVKIEDFPKWFAENQGIDLSLLYSQDELKEKMEAEKEAATQQQGMDQMSQGSEMVKNMGGVEGMEQAAAALGGGQPPPPKQG